MDKTKAKTYSILDILKVGKTGDLFGVIEGYESIVYTLLEGRVKHILSGLDPDTPPPLSNVSLYVGRAETLWFVRKECYEVSVQDLLTLAKSDCLFIRDINRDSKSYCLIRSALLEASLANDWYDSTKSADELYNDLFPDV